MSTPLELLTNPAKFKEGMERVKATLKKITITGSAGGKMVEIRMNGGYEVVSVHIDPVCVDPSDVKTLESLVKSALVDAVEKVTREMKERPSVLFEGFV